MPPASVIQRSFAAGELAPVLHARADHEKYTAGLKTCRNFLVLRHGAVANRGGFRFVAECKTNNANVRLQRYVSENPNESILIEVGSGYFRFFKNGAPIVVSGVTAWSNATAYVAGDLASNAGVNYYCILAHTNQVPPNATYWYPLAGDLYEIPTPYTTGGLIGGWEQSGNVVAITHRLHDPRELVHSGDTSWVLRLADTEPSIVAPAGLALAPIAGAQTYSYVVTSVKAETLEESLPTVPITDAAIAVPTAAAPHALTWTLEPDASEYNVYCDPTGNGIFGFIGAAASNLFNNPGYTPDFQVTPPLDRTPFVSAETRPHVATHYQQRRFYANAIATPERIEGSRTGFFNNFGVSSPLQDDDALSFRMVGRNYHAVRHMLGLKRLIVFTDGGAWSVGRPNEPLTPFTLGGDQETYAGAAPDVPPVVIGNSAVYLQARGSIVRDLRFDQDVEGLNGRDLTLFASHLVDGHVIDRMDYAETPHSIVWCVRDDGTLLGLTYIREENVWGWHRHDTDGDFEQVCTVPEAAEDAVYVVVRRTIGGATVRYIERLASREIVTFDEDAFFVDSGLSYSGAPATAFTGLGHLEGERVAIVADGAVVSDGSTAAYVVTAGGVTIPAAASNVHVGLPITADFETLNIDANGTAVRDKKKRVGALTLIVDKSSRSFSAGPDTGNLTGYDLSTLETATDEHTGHVEMSVSATFNDAGSIIIRQTDPLPLTILGILPNLIVGG